VDKKSYEGEASVRLCNYTDVYYNDQITGDMELMAATASPEQIERFTLRAGDTIITKDSETADDIAVSAYVPKDLPGVVCGYHLAMIRPGTNTRGAFVKRLFDSTFARSCFEIRANGLTRVGLGQHELDNVELPFPPIGEQTTIAEFLDRETAKIDALVAEQQQLLELLKEKRQAVISHAVTKGLNPKTPLKHSGVEWLGEIPAHWSVKRLKHISPFMTVGVVVNPSSFVSDEGLPFIYGGDIREGVIDWENSRRISAESCDANAKTRLESGDLLTVRVGAPGVTAVVPPECEGGNCASVMLIRRGGYNSDWLCYAMNTRIVRFQVEVVQYGAAQEQFNIAHAVNFWVPAPPRDEQDKIATFLAKETAHFDALTAEAQRAIDLLQERRTALISAAVTGQIDVRKVVPAESSTASGVLA
jgi:type I restriction enzyme S subunit